MKTILLLLYLSSLFPLFSRRIRARLTRTLDLAWRLTVVLLLMGLLLMADRPAFGQQMTVAVQSARTTLSAAMTNSQMTVPLVDATWPMPNLPFRIVVENENIRVCALNGSALEVCPTGAGRGANGTVSKTHAVASVVWLYDEKKVSTDSVASLQLWAAALEPGTDAEGNPTSKPRYRDDVQAFVKQLKPWFKQFIDETPGGTLATAQAALSAAQSTLDAAKANAEP